ncbi:hypothetical protein SLE2022_273310 [Rubroshorea leprosula]
MKRWNKGEFRRKYGWIGRSWILDNVGHAPCYHLQRSPCLLPLTGLSDAMELLRPEGAWNGSTCLNVRNHDHRDGFGYI